MNRAPDTLLVNGIYLEEMPLDTIEGLVTPIVRKKRIDLGVLLIDNLKKKTPVTDPAFLLMLNPRQSYEYIFTFKGLENFEIKTTAKASPISKFNLVVSFKDPNTGLTSQNPLREFVFGKYLKSN